MYTKIRGQNCVIYSDIRAKEPVGSLAVLEGGSDPNQANCRNSGPFVGVPVGVVGVDLGEAVHAVTVLLKSGQGGDQAGEGTADGEFVDAFLLEGFGDGRNILVPNDLGEIDAVVAIVLAVAVSPEDGGVDAFGSDVLDAVGDGVLKSGNLLHGVYLRKMCFPFGSTHIRSTSEI